MPGQSFVKTFEKFCENFWKPWYDHLYMRLPATLQEAGSYPAAQRKIIVQQLLDRARAAERQAQADYALAQAILDADHQIACGEFVAQFKEGMHR